MDFTIHEPCAQSWEQMQRVGGGRHCAECDKAVLDLSRMTRRAAERRVAAAEGESICVRLAVGPDEAPLFRPEPRRAPHWAGGLVLVAALTGGCSGARPDAPLSKTAPVAASVGEPEVSCASPGGEPPMRPATAPVPEPWVTGPVPAEELPRPPEAASPTAAQRALTRAKRLAPLPSPPPRHYRMGGLRAAPRLHRARPLSPSGNSG